MIIPKSMIALLMALLTAAVYLFIQLSSSPYGFFSLENQNVSFNLERKHTGNELARLTFRSPLDGLGVITLEFDSVIAPSYDRVILELYRDGAKTPFHVHPYVIKNFYDLPKFPLGLPLQEKSKGVTYLVVLRYDDLDSRQQSKLIPSQLHTVHFTTKSKLFASKRSLLQFTYNKITTSVSPAIFMLSGFTFFVWINLSNLLYFLSKLGLLTCKLMSILHSNLLYFLSNLGGRFGLVPRYVVTFRDIFAVSFRRLAKFLRYVVAFRDIFVIVLVITVILVSSSYPIRDEWYAIWGFLYTIGARYLRLPPETHFAFAIMSFVVFFVCTLLGDAPRAEKAAVFVYFWMIALVTSAAGEIIKQNSKRTTNSQVKYECK